MQTVESLSFEAIPSPFCGGGSAGVDYAVISNTPTDSFSYVLGLADEFSSENFVMRQHMNAIGRLGTFAQALIQAGGMVGLVEEPGMQYGDFSVAQLVDGSMVTCWRSNTDQNQQKPPGADDGRYYLITNSDDVDDGIPVDSRTWDRASPPGGGGFFDVS